MIQHVLIIRLCLQQIIISYLLHTIIHLTYYTQYVLVYYVHIYVYKFLHVAQMKSQILEYAGRLQLGFCRTGVYGQPRVLYGLIKRCIHHNMVKNLEITMPLFYLFRKPHLINCLTLILYHSIETVFTFPIEYTYFCHPSLTAYEKAKSREPTFSQALG